MEFPGPVPEIPVRDINKAAASLLSQQAESSTSPSHREARLTSGWITIPARRRLWCLLSLERSQTIADQIGSLISCWSKPPFGM